MSRLTVVFCVSVPVLIAQTVPLAHAQDATARDKKSLALATSSLGAKTPVTVPVYATNRRNAAPGAATYRRAAASAYPRTHFQKAMYWKGKGDKNRALVEFLKASQENPRLVRAFYEQALIFHERGYLKLAESSLEQALAVQHDYKEARILLATVQIEQGNVTDAVQQLGKSLGLAMPEPGKSMNGSAGSTSPTVLQSVHPTISMPAISRPAISMPVFSRPALKQPRITNGGGQSKMPLPSGSQSQPADTSSTTTASKKPISGRSQSPPQTGSRLIRQTSAANQPEPAQETGETAKLSSSSALTDRKANDQAKSESSDRKESAEAIFGWKLPNPFHMFRSEVPPNKASSEPDADEGKGRKEHNGKASRIKHRKLARDQNEVSEQNADSLAKANHEKKSKGWFARLFAKDSEKSDGESGASNEKGVTASGAEGGEERAADNKIATADPIDDRSSPDAKSDTTAGTLSDLLKPDRALPIDESEHERKAAEPQANSATTPIAKEDQAADRIGQLFQFPQLFDSTIFKAFAAKWNAPSQPAAPQTSPSGLSPTANNDPWSVRLRYLCDHGTSTLKEGEAYIFSEDSGEATLFLADGRVVRRTIYLPRDEQEVVQERRPDILKPAELVYKLELLAKLLPRQPQAATETAQVPAPAQSGDTFAVDDLMGSSKSFWSRLKNAFKF